MQRTNLIDARKRLGLTQSELAATVGIHRSYYGLIETGYRNPTLGIAIKIATALNSSVEHLFPNDIFFGNKCYETKL